MAEYDVLRQEILSLLARITEAAEERGTAGETTDRLYGARERLASGRLSVVVCGEFKRGKSSLLNALLEQPNLLPVDMFFTTRLVTTVAYGDQERIHVTLAGHGAGAEGSGSDLGGAPGSRPAAGQTAPPAAPAPPERRRIERAQIGSYAAQGTTHPDAERALLLEIELPDPRLASGLVLVDTPGVGGVYHDHTLATQQYLPTADAVLFVSSAQEPLSDSEVGFLAQAAHAVGAADRPDAMMFALTHIDLVPDVDDFLAGVRARIAEVTGKPVAAIEVLPISSTAKITGLVTGNRDLLHHSGFARLEAAVWSRLARHRAKVLLGGALSELESAVHVLLSPLRAEEQAQRETGRARVGSLEREMERESARLAELADGAASWRAELDSELALLERRLGERGAAEFDTVWQRAEQEYLQVDRYLQEPDQLADRVNSDLGVALSAVSTWGAGQAARTQRDITERIGLELTGSALRGLPSPPVVDLGAFGRLHRPTRRVIHRTEAEYETVTETFTLPRSPRKQAIATGIGRFLGKGFQRAAEATMDFFSAPRTETFTSRRQVRPASEWEEVVTEEVSPEVMAARRRELAVALQDARSTQSHRIGAVVERTMAEFRSEIGADMDSRITRERQRIDDTLPRLRSTLVRTEAEGALRLAELAEEQRPLAEAESEVNRLASAVGRLAGTESGEDGGSREDAGAGHFDGPGDGRGDGA